MKLEEISIAEYDDFIQSNISPIFHQTWWFKCVKEFYGNKLKFKFFSIRQDNEILSVIPIPIRRKYMLNVVVNPILTPYLGPLYSESILKGRRTKVLSKVKEINNLFSKVFKKVYIYRFFPYWFNTYLLPYKWEGFHVGVSYTYTVDLTQSLENIWKEIDKKRKWDIRKAEKMNLEIVEDEINDFIRLSKLTFERQRKDLDLDRIWKLLFRECKRRGLCKIWTAYLNERPIASLFLVWDSEWGYYLGGGIDENSRGAMSLLIWNAIKFCKSKGLKVFDFEGSEIPSIERYFRKFGGILTPVYYIQSPIFSLLRR